MTAAPSRRAWPLWALLLGAGLLLGLCLGFTALGLWQIQRMHWKHALIERVEHRVHAPPVAAPSDWSAVTRDRDEYRRVQLRGSYLPGKDTYVQALTQLGAGRWILSPLRDPDGRIVLVNRGFAPDGDLERVTTPPAGEVDIVGLLRISEPGGGFLRHNDPASNRWYSRDVNAIADARGLGEVAPYFIDALADGTDHWPRGGMTVLSFRDNHLSYALTWFVLAALVAYALWRFLSSEWRLRHHARLRPPEPDTDAGPFLPRE